MTGIAEAPAATWSSSWTEASYMAVVPLSAATAARTWSFTVSKSFTVSGERPVTSNRCRTS